MGEHEEHTAVTAWAGDTIYTFTLDCFGVVLKEDPKRLAAYLNHIERHLEKEGLRWLPEYPLFRAFAQRYLEVLIQGDCVREVHIIPLVAIIHAVSWFRAGVAEALKWGFFSNPEKYTTQIDRLRTEALLHAQHWTKECFPYPTQPEELDNILGGIEDVYLFHVDDVTGIHFN
jgi:hypothetical protein